MSVQVYSVPRQTEGRRKAFFGMEKHYTYPMNYLLYVGVILYYKSVHHPIPTRDNREHPGTSEK